MDSLWDMIWIEQRKAIRSKMVLGTMLVSLIVPFALGMMLWISRNPEISQKLGLMGAKANLVAFAAVDWPAYAALFGQVIGAVGFILSMFVTAWVFGREFSDGTVKDMLAVPVSRSIILTAKFILVAAWSALLTGFIFASGMVVGMLLQLPGGSMQAVLHGLSLTAVTAGLVIVVVIPFAFLASLGRGYLLPISMALVALGFANLAIVLERAEFYPWAIPMLYAEGKTPLHLVSFVIVLFTGVLGWLATDYWWKHADQSK